MREWVHADTHGWVLNPRSAADWQALVDEYGGKYPAPFEQLLAVVRAADCKTVIVENRYVDGDYRSEYSGFWSLRFRSPPPFARRLHFFVEVLADDQIHNIPDDAEYLGYSVLRPTDQGRLGRTVVAPPPDLAGATLALIEDEVSLFGNRRRVRGAPFCQQDCEYLRCAQAAAWMCHYSAYRKGLVGRHTTASIVEHTPSLLSPERALPSKGMTLNQLQAVFGALGQPALFYGLSNMPRVRGVPDPPAQTDPASGEPLRAGLWDTRIFSVICRYLNSGFPVLIGSDDHAFVLVGWYRDPSTDQVHFIATDDQKGPYEVIDSPFSHYKAPWRSIMVPLPPKVFLTGEAAENAAYRYFLAIGLSVSALEPLAKALESGDLELRASLKEGRQFKTEVAEQTSSDEGLRALRLARLPHYVWSIEAHQRSACAKDEACVYAAAVYDATSSDLEPGRDAMSLPGVVAVYPPDGGTAVVVQGGPAPWHSMLKAH